MSHNTQKADTLFDLISEKITKGYPVGAGTSEFTKLVKTHAYTVLNTYNLKLRNGQNVKLIKCYNPWRKDSTWSDNPWNDDKAVWTDELKSLTGQANNLEDGVFFLSPEDYYSNFDSTSWVTARRDYDVAFADVPIDPKITTSTKYSTTFTVNNPSGEAIYVYIDVPNRRLFKNTAGVACNQPYKVDYFSAKSGADTFKPVYEGQYVLKVYKSGTYNFDFSITNSANYNNFVTITAYGPKGTVEFAKQNSKVGLNCAALKNCNFNGFCNTLTGTCQCNVGVPYFLFKIDF